MLITDQVEPSNPSLSDNPEDYSFLRYFPSLQPEVDWVISNRGIHTSELERARLNGELCSTRLESAHTLRLLHEAGWALARGSEDDAWENKEMAERRAQAARERAGSDFIRFCEHHEAAQQFGDARDSVLESSEGDYASANEYKELAEEDGNNAELLRQQAREHFTDARRWRQYAKGNFQRADRHAYSNRKEKRSDSKREAADGRRFQAMAENAEAQGCQCRQKAEQAEASKHENQRLSDEFRNTASKKKRAANYLKTLARIHTEAAEKANFSLQQEQESFDAGVEESQGYVEKAEQQGIIADGVQEQLSQDNEEIAQLEEEQQQNDEAIAQLEKKLEEDEVILEELTKRALEITERDEESSDGVAEAIELTRRAKERVNVLIALISAISGPLNTMVQTNKNTPKLACVISQGMHALNEFDPQILSTVALSVFAGTSEREILFSNLAANYRRLYPSFSVDWFVRFLSLSHSIMATGKVMGAYETTASTDDVIQLLDFSLIYSHLFTSSLSSGADLTKLYSQSSIYLPLNFFTRALFDVVERELTKEGLLPTNKFYYACKELASNLNFLGFQFLPVDYTLGENVADALKLKGPLVVVINAVQGIHKKQTKEALLRNIKYFLDNALYKKVMFECEKFLKEQGFDVDIDQCLRIARGFHYLGGQQYDAFIEQNKNDLQAYPENGYLITQKASMHFRSQQWSEAEQAARCVPGGETNPSVLTLLAEVYNRQGLWSPAAYNRRRALQVVSNNDAQRRALLGPHTPLIRLLKQGVLFPVNRLADVTGQMLAAGVKMWHGHFGFLFKRFSQPVLIQSDQATRSQEEKNALETHMQTVYSSLIAHYNQQPEVASYMIVPMKLFNYRLLEQSFSKLVYDEMQLIKVLHLLFGADAAFSRQHANSDILQILSSLLFSEDDNIRFVSLFLLKICVADHKPNEFYSNLAEQGVRLAKGLSSVKFTGEGKDLANALIADFGSLVDLYQTNSSDCSYFRYAEVFSFFVREIVDSLYSANFSDLSSHKLSVFQAYLQLGNAVTKENVFEILHQKLTHYESLSFYQCYLLGMFSFYMALNVKSKDDAIKFNALAHQFGFAPSYHHYAKITLRHETGDYFCFGVLEDVYAYYTVETLPIHDQLLLLRFWKLNAKKLVYSKNDFWPGKGRYEILGNHIRKEILGLDSSLDKRLINLVKKGQYDSHFLKEFRDLLAQGADPEAVVESFYLETTGLSKAFAGRKRITRREAKKRILDYLAGLIGQHIGWGESNKKVYYLLDAIKYLHIYGAGFSLVNYIGETPLHHLVIELRGKSYPADLIEKVIELLIRRGVDPNVSSKFSYELLGLDALNVGLIFHENKSLGVRATELCDAFELPNTKKIIQAAGNGMSELNLPSVPIHREMQSVSVAIREKMGEKVTLQRQAYSEAQIRALMTVYERQFKNMAFEMLDELFLPFLPSRCMYAIRRDNPHFLLHRDGDKIKQLYCFYSVNRERSVRVINFVSSDNTQLLALLRGENISAAMTRLDQLAPEEQGVVCVAVIEAILQQGALSEDEIKSIASIERLFILRSKQATILSPDVVNKQYKNMIRSVNNTQRDIQQIIAPTSFKTVIPEDKDNKQGLFVFALAIQQGLKRYGNAEFTGLARELVQGDRVTVFNRLVEKLRVLFAWGTHYQKENINEILTRSLSYVLQGRKSADTSSILDSNRILLDEIRARSLSLFRNNNFKLIYRKLLVELLSFPLALDFIKKLEAALRAGLKDAQSTHVEAFSAYQHFLERECQAYLAQQGVKVTNNYQGFFYLFLINQAVWQSIPKAERTHQRGQFFNRKIQALHYHYLPSLMNDLADEQMTNGKNVLKLLSFLVFSKGMMFYNGNKLALTCIDAQGLEEKMVHQFNLLSIYLNRRQIYDNYYRYLCDPQQAVILTETELSHLAASVGVGLEIIDSSNNVKKRGSSATGVSVICLHQNAVGNWQIYVDSKLKIVSDEQRRLYSDVGCGRAYTLSNFRNPGRDFRRMDKILEQVCSSEDKIRQVGFEALSHVEYVTVFQYEHLIKGVISAALEDPYQTVRLAAIKAWLFKMPENSLVGYFEQVQRTLANIYQDFRDNQIVSGALNKFVESCCQYFYENYIQEEYNHQRREQGLARIKLLPVLVTERLKKCLIGVMDGDCMRSVRRSAARYLLDIECQGTDPYDYYIARHLPVSSISAHLKRAQALLAKAPSVAVPCRSQQAAPASKGSLFTMFQPVSVSATGIVANKSAEYVR